MVDSSGRGACWLRCTSRCVSSWFSGPDALHHGWYGLAGTVCGAVQKTVESPQLQFIYGCRHSFRAAESDPHGPVGRKTTEAHQLQSVDG